MKKKRIIILVVLFLFMFSIVSCSIIRISYINRIFPDPVIKSHMIGEIITGGNVSICIDEAELYNGDEIESKYNFTNPAQNEDGTRITGDQFKVLTICHSVINNTNEAQEISLAQFYAESLTWSNGIDAQLFPVFNSDNKDTDYLDPQRIELTPNQIKKVYLTYTMFHFQFNPIEWEKIKIDNFDLSLSRYPVKHIVTLC